MEARQLRIGNWVRSSLDESYNIDRQVEVLEPERLSFLGEWYVGYDEIEPIRLTEEWLVKFGFLLTVSLYDKWMFAIRRDLSGDGWTVFWGDNKLSLVDITFVHQLQNLFFCLCGEELTIKD